MENKCPDAFLVSKSVFAMGSLSKWIYFRRYYYMVLERDEKIIQMDYNMGKWCESA